MKKIMFFMLAFLINLMFIYEVDASVLHCDYDVAGYKVTFEKGTVLKSGKELLNDLTFERKSVSLSIYSESNKDSYYILADLTVGAGSDYTRRYDSRISDPKFIIHSGDYGQLTTCPKVGVSDKGSLILFPTTASAEGQAVASAYKTTYNGVNTTGTCLAYDDPTRCKSPSVGHCTGWGCNATGPSCVWNDVSIDGKSYGYCNTDKLLYIKCGDAKDIPYQVPQVVSFAVNFLKILTPLILIFISIISLLKAISASNEDEIKKAQKGLIRKIIAAVMVFFIISIVQFVIMLVADNETKSDENDIVETKNLSDCLNCFLNNKCGDSIYYRTNIAGEYVCTYVNNPNKKCEYKTLTKEKVEN